MAFDGNLSSVKIFVRDNLSQSPLATLELPSFCLEHMKLSSAKANLEMMKKHINSSIKPKRCGDVFLDGLKMEEIPWTVCAEKDLHIDVQTLI